MGKPNKLATTAIVIMAALLSTYIMEDRSEMVDTFNYYGNITTKPVFTYPEKISLWSFGQMTDDTREARFIIQLWCGAINPPQTKELIETRLNHVPEYSFGNILPQQVADRIIPYVSVSGQLSKPDRVLIRKQNEETPYYAWDFDNIKPTVSSVCHTIVTPNVYTPIFKITKSDTFIGHEFVYMVPTD